MLLRDCHDDGGERDTLPRSGGLSTYGSTAINFQRLVTETVHISAFLWKEKGIADLVMGFSFSCRFIESPRGISFDL